MRKMGGGEREGKLAYVWHLLLASEIHAVPEGKGGISVPLPLYLVGTVAVAGCGCLALMMYRYVGF